MIKKVIITILSLMAGLCSTKAQNLSESRRAVDFSTDIIAVLPTAAALAGSLITADYQGTKQLALGAVSAIGTSYTLKYIIKKERPLSSLEGYAFPSNHCSAAFQGASFIHIRYGWKLAIPAYALAAYTAWGRIYSRNHDVVDVLAGAALGAGASLLFTRRRSSRDSRLIVTPAWTNKENFGVYACLTF